MRCRLSYIQCLLVCMLLCVCIPLQAGNGKDELDRRIKMPKLKGTVYQLLNRVTEYTDYLFIYDSRTLRNEQKSSIAKGEYSIREAIHTITGNPGLELRLVDNHILIHLPVDEAIELSELSETKEDEDTPVEEEFFTITGTLYDKETQEPIIYASVGINEAGIGTITNMNGEFKLRLPVAWRQARLYLSHLGYVSETIPCELLADKYSTFSLESNTVSLQEVVIHAIDPLVVIREMLEKRKDNYMDKPVYLTTFYREGIEQRKGLVSLSEGVFKVHKYPFMSSMNDQIKLLKMRRVNNIHEKDTLITKIKAGINACLMLDIIKQLPEFLRAEKESPYVYNHSAITVIDNRYIDVIDFTQQKGYTDPLYRGKIYIDKDSRALLKSEFEIHPEHIKKATNMFVERKSRSLQITPQEIKYTVSYKLWNGKYYISHVRGDLFFRIKKKKQLFSSTNIHTWFEMATCKIEENDVSRFSRSETLSTRTIFADTQFEYDNNFWGGFNIIIPENELSDALRKISSKIEETGI